MKQLDKMYDLLFQDEEMLKLYSYFYSSKWDELTIEEKKDIVTNIHERTAKIYGYKPCKLVYIKQSHLYGGHSGFDGSIVINEEVLKQDCAYETIDTYYHELRHHFQDRAVEHELTDKEYVDPKLLTELEKNMTPGNYFGSGDPYYKFQPMERDAWSIGMLMTRKIYMMNKEKEGKEDPKWKDYCAEHKDVIVNFISENEKSEKLLAQMDEEINAIYESRIDDKPQYQKGKEIAKAYKGKDLESLAFEEIALLMSPYVFNNFDISEKVKIIQNYATLRKYKRRMQVKENTIGSIKIGRILVTIDSSINMVNVILSDNFKKMVDDAVKGKNQTSFLDEAAKEEVALNMYEDEQGKKINYVTDQENLFMFSIQPYAKYESMYAKSLFMEMMKVEKDVFGKNHDNWDYWINFYDNDMIFETASEIMGKPFDEIYNEQLDKYRQNIDASKKSNTIR